MCDMEIEKKIEQSGPYSAAPMAYLHLSEIQEDISGNRIASESQTIRVLVQIVLERDSQ